ncbi:MAG: glycosyl hydrolase family 8 [Acetobacteraceae bacterium]
MGAETVPRPRGQVSVPEVDRREWATFKARFISPEGRVVDTGNKGVSHSEGQGVGMLLAVAFDDRDTFDRLRSWTAANLRRTDGLHAWRWIPGQVEHVPDTNNATDGDLYIAGALNRASLRWQSPAYADAAQVTARSILDQLVETIGPRMVLLPGAEGFVKRTHIAVNLSYYIFPLLQELDIACPSPNWGRLQRDGATLIAEGRFGPWQLPPDWLEIRRADGSLAPARGFPARFSYDAVRVPLFLAWSGEQPAVTQAIAAFWAQGPQSLPRWADLQTNMTDRLWGSGIQAIAALIDPRLGGRQKGRFPQTSPQDDYYSSSLLLLSGLAYRENVATVS